MRTYFEKPRTIVGWKGLINDPRLDGSFDVNEGLKLARKLLVDINALGMPTATEFLDMVTGQYISDLITWGAIGARTTESQVHREMASALSCPVGFKNGTDGNTRIAIDAVRAARHSHIFYSPDKDGKMTIYRTAGNPYGHVILRGGHRPNYDTASIDEACEALADVGLPERLVVDFSHGNSMKDHRRQLLVAQDICDQLRRVAPASPASWPRASWWKGGRMWRTAAPSPSARASPMPVCRGATPKPCWPCWQKPPRCALPSSRPECG